MALSDILQKIKADYEDRAQKIVDTTISEAEKMGQSFEKDEHEKNELRWQRAMEIKNETIKKAHIKTDLQSRQKVLAEKHRLISTVFDSARNKLEKLPSEKYIEFITSLIGKIDNDEGEIVVPANRIDETKRVINSLKKHFKVQEGKFKGGFIFRSRDIEINATFERLFEDLRRQHESEVAKILFEK